MLLVEVEKLGYSFFFIKKQKRKEGGGGKDNGEKML